MTTDLKNLLKEESNKLSIKEKEFESLILDFENQFKTENTEFNVKFSQIVSKKSIYLSFSLKNHSFTFIYTLDKEKETYNTEYYEEHFSASNSNIKECIDLLSFIHKETKSKTFEELFEFLKNHQSLYNSVNRIKNKINDISLDISKNKDSGLINKLKFFLSSEKEIIKKNIHDFSNKEEFEKEIVCFDIKRYSDKKISFINTFLSVSTSSGKRLFKFNGRAISKKQAIDLLNHQVFNNSKEISNFKEVPFYKNPDISYVSRSWRKSWNINVEDYIKLVKPEVLIQYNINTF